jgi:5-keto 4-deoxyuronate isomerase
VVRPWKVWNSMPVAIDERTVEFYPALTMDQGMELLVEKPVY